MSVNERVLVEIKTLFNSYGENDALEVISLATTDGFPIYTHKQIARTIEEDTLSAAASTLHSVSNAVAQQILGKSFRVTFIEAEQGNVAIVDLTIASQNCVLVMSASEALNIASLRLLITRLANEIQTAALNTAAASA
ncbi:roadblock/LC7 domain-containing protein [Simiduia sp. 21SJ11W-1]|uniref:roadblock/LC7 domain-containing protein n=1 Tax=Simiduia sp. 21SJ11W-1 TaxID=2909669 RepID=UPI00209FBEA6|nr:roadblock/LC7 domain-containing protein [Simiduia sp. 21SJ11W-1]UTA47958.1 roadblock/LC7 domain-containing protein [Simiduia sp. 21SJ11W-1]